MHAPCVQHRVQCGRGHRSRQPGARQGAAADCCPVPPTPPPRKAVAAANHKDAHGWCACSSAQLSSAQLRCTEEWGRRHRHRTEAAHAWCTPPPRQLQQRGCHSCFDPKNMDLSHAASLAAAAIERCSRAGGHRRHSTRSGRRGTVGPSQLAGLVWCPAHTAHHHAHTHGANTDWKGAGWRAAGGQLHQFHARE
jgi:hypothetical protein